MLLLNCILRMLKCVIFRDRHPTTETANRSSEIARAQSSRERVTACRLSKHTLKIWKRNGTGLWPDLHVTAAHHISGFSAGFPSLLSALARRASPRARGWSRVGTPSGSSENVDVYGQDREKTESSNEDARREGGKEGVARGRKKKRRVAGGGYVSTGYAGNINTAGLSNEPECDLRIFQRAGGLAWNRAPTEQS